LQRDEGLINQSNALHVGAMTSPSSQTLRQTSPQTSGQTSGVAVVGGGFAGLAAAYRLARAGHSVTVFEKSGQLGGLAMTFPLGETEIEKYYHHWFTSD